jgi:hypothetical protein
MLSIGRRKVVECKPNTPEPEWVLALAIEWIVRIEPVGDRGLDRYGYCDRVIKDLPKHKMS